MRQVSEEKMSRGCQELRAWQRWAEALEIFEKFLPCLTGRVRCTLENEERQGRTLRVRSGMSVDRLEDGVLLMTVQREFVKKGVRLLLGHTEFE